MKNVFNAFVEISSISDCGSLSTDSLRRQDGNKAFLYLTVALVIDYKFRSHGLCFSKAFGNLLTHRKRVIPPKLQALNYRKASPFPSSIMDLQSGRLCLCYFPHAYLLCMAAFLSIAVYSVCISDHSQSPCASGHRELEDTDVILLRAEPVLLSFVCLCFFFLFSSRVKLPVLSTGS